jgi:pimeloyl-ACP methyl ester carboxylesterase
MGLITGRAGALAGLTVAAAAATAAVGVAAAQRRAARAIVRRPDPEAHETLGTPIGELLTVEASDGALLAVELRDADRGDDPLTVLFVHGYALNASTWHYQFKELAGAARLVAYDQRGHRHSTVSDDEITIDRLALDLLEVMEATAPDGPVVLVGHSMGGMAVMRLAAMRPELFGSRVVGVALLATAADRGDDNELAIAGAWGQLAGRLGPGFSAVLTPRPEVIERSMRVFHDLVMVMTEHYGFGSKAPASLVEHTKRMHELVQLDRLVSFLPMFNLLELGHDLAALQQVDVVVVVGDADRMTPPRLSEQLIRRLPNADLVLLADTGHMLMLERHAAVSEAVNSLVVRARRAMDAA